MTCGPQGPCNFITGLVHDDDQDFLLRWGSYVSLSQNEVGAISVSKSVERIPDGLKLSFQLWIDGIFVLGNAAE